MKSVMISAAVLALLAGTAQAQVSDDVVKIAVLDDMSGVYADLTGPGGVAAVRMAIEDFGGKVLGKSIDLVFADHQNKADVAAAAGRQWFDVDKVDMVTGLGNSAVALAIQQLAREKNRINIVSGAASTDLTGKSCSPNGLHWTYDTYALAKGTGTAAVKAGGDTWFFLTADYAFGHSLEANTANVVRAAGGKVLGAVRHPLNTPDFSSFLLQAQGSGAKIIGLANAGGDTINSIKQAGEFGIGKTQKLAGLLVTITDVHGVGLKAAQGLLFTEAFYWDQNEATRAWSKRFMERHKNAPTMIQAGMYGATMHYLKAVQAAGTDEPKAVMAKMKEAPVNDFMTKNGKIRPDGRLVRDMYLLQVKAPEESKGPWDYMKVVATIPGEEAFRPVSEGGCPLVTQ
ncbi:MAG: transporter substrate-binding protein [Microvirga sp.]|jgi:branched-chain amino acid transport system substrate-binding protein|nr:transporter substrate-binding protein [Microvirga sp.]